MRDRRSVDDLSIDELERVLAIKKRQAREARLRKFRSTGRALRAEVSGEPLPPAGAGGAPAPRTRAARFGNVSLLLIEIAAVFGLLFIGVSAFNTYRTLNAEVSEVIAAESAPTIAPTPIIGSIVLPSGHTPPTSPGGAQFNIAEIPEHLRPVVQALPVLDIPTPSPQQASRLVIPALNVDAPITQGDSWEQLKRGVGQHLGTADPGQSGNVVLSAHNDIFGELFRYLDQLTAGDTFTIYTTGSSFTYEVTGWDVVSPTAVHVMGQTASPTATLISCYPYLVDTERIVVFAELQD
ncbi:MAG: sortase [Anaerolineales bacterium]